MALQLRSETEAINFVKLITSEAFFDPTLEGRISRGLHDNIIQLASFLNSKPDYAKKVMRELKKRIKTGKPDIQILAIEIIEGVMIHSPVAHKCFDNEYQRSLNKVSHSTNNASVRQHLVGLSSRYLAGKLVFPGGPPPTNQQQQPTNPNPAPISTNEAPNSPPGEPHSPNSLLSQGWTLHKDVEGRFFYKHPSGATTYWEKRVDVSSGRSYYVNHYDKSTQWKDPFTKPASMRPNHEERNNKPPPVSSPKPISLRTTRAEVKENESKSNRNSEKINLNNVETTIKSVNDMLTAIETGKADPSTEETVKLLVSEIRELDREIQEKIPVETNEMKLNRYLEVNDMIQAMSTRYRQFVQNSKNRPVNPPLPARPQSFHREKVTEISNNNNQVQSQRNPPLYPALGRAKPIGHQSSPSILELSSQQPILNPVVSAPTYTSPAPANPSPTNPFSNGTGNSFNSQSENNLPSGSTQNPSSIGNPFIDPTPPSSQPPPPNPFMMSEPQPFSPSYPQPPSFVPSQSQQPFSPIHPSPFSPSYPGMPSSLYSSTPQQQPSPFSPAQPQQPFSPIHPSPFSPAPTPPYSAMPSTLYSSTPQQQPSPFSPSQPQQPFSLMPPQAPSYSELPPYNPSFTPPHYDPSMNFTPSAPPADNY